MPPRVFAPGWVVILVLLSLPSLTACRRAEITDAPFSVAVPYELTSLDPHLANTIFNYSVLSNVFEPLVSADADLRIQPALALSWENPDPFTWVFRLRPSVSFHSGRTLSARDVVYSLERLRTEPNLKMRAFVQIVTEVRAVDGLTVRIRTSRSSRVLLSKLRFALIVPEGATTTSLERSPDGTGPYALAGWTRGQPLTLRRHEAHWGRAGRLRQVTVVMGLPPEQEVAGLLSRRFQLVQENNLDLSLENRLAGSPDHEVIRRDNIHTKYIGYDLGRDQTPFCAVRPNPFRDLRVRQALNLALDRSALVGRLPVEARPANQPVPHFIFGFNPALPPLLPDLEAARALLRRAGLGSGFEVVLHSRRMFLEAAQAVRDQWGRVGVKVRPEILADEVYFAGQDRHAHTLWLTRFGCPSGDASDFLDAVVHSRDEASHYGTQNHGQFSDPVLDRAIERAAEIEEADRRRVAVQDAVAATTERLVVLPLYFDQDVYAFDRAFAWSPRRDSYLRVADIEPRPR